MKRKIIFKVCGLLYALARWLEKPYWKKIDDEIDRLITEE